MRFDADCMLGLDGVPVLTAGDEAVDALVELYQSTVNRGLVLDGARLAGLLSITDLARALDAAPRRRRAPTATPARGG